MDMETYLLPLTIIAPSKKTYRLARTDPPHFQPIMSCHHYHSAQNGQLEENQSKLGFFFPLNTTELLNEEAPFPIFYFIKNFNSVSEVDHVKFIAGMRCFNSRYITQ